MPSSLNRGKYVIGGVIDDHRARSSGVDTFIVGEEPVYREGRSTRIDKEAVLQELAASLSGPRTSVEEQRRQIARDVYGHVEAF